MNAIEKMQKEGKLHDFAMMLWAGRNCPTEYGLTNKKPCSEWKRGCCVRDCWEVFLTKDYKGGE